MRHLASALLLVGSIAQAQVVCDQFEPKAALDGMFLSAWLETDLPDSTNITVTVSRSYRALDKLSGSVNQYPVNYSYSRAKVRDWRNPRRIELDNALWRRTVDDTEQKAAALGFPSEIRGVATDIRVSFVVPISQEDPRFGPRNEKLEGKKVRIYNDRRNVSAEQRLRFPLTPAKAQQPAHSSLPSAAEPRPRTEGPRFGTRYQVAGGFSIYEQRSSAAARNIEVPAEGLLTVLSVDRRDPESSWYQVQVQSADGADLGQGWISGTELASRMVEQVQP